jgi:DNA-binding CsgD family transcriptional regulator
MSDARCEDMDEKQFAAIEEKLDKITRLLAHQAVKDLSKEQDKIDLLDRLGLRSGEIAKYLGKSTQNVSTVLGNIRKKEGGVGKTEPGESSETKEEVAQSKLEPLGQNSEGEKKLFQSRE